MDSPVRIYVVDDDEEIRQSLTWLIESVGLPVTSVESATEFTKAFDPDQPGCVVLDVRMPGKSGLELLEDLRAEGVGAPVIVITGFGDVRSAVRAMKAGAVDFVEKPLCDQELIERVQRAVEQESRKHDAIKEKRRILELVDRLTKREREVMDLVVEGLSSKQVAEQLDVSFKTIEAHRAKIMRKMEAQSVPHLVRMRMLVDGEL